MASVIIVAIVLGYSVWVVRRRLQKIKKGQFCSCGCENCQSQCSEKNK